MTREEAIEELSVIWERLSHPEECENGCYSFRDGDYLEALDMAIEALKDRLQGEWKFVDNEIFAGEYFCSICGKRAEVDLYGEWILSNFCPSCGVKMTPYKESEDEE